MPSKSDLILRSPRSGCLEGRTAPAPSDQVGDTPAGPGKRVCVGVIAGAHGVRGAVRVKSFTAAPEDVARYGPLEDESGERHLSLRLIGNAKGVVVARIAGVADRDRAEAMRGLRLYLPRAALPPAADDEYYHADLIGLRAALADGTMLGHVRAVYDFGAGDTLELERPEGPPALVPFTRAIVPVVDLAGGRIVIEPPPGLIEPLSTNPLPPMGGAGRVRGANSAPSASQSPRSSRPMGEREKKGNSG